MRKQVDVARRADAYHMPGVIVDGNDVDAVFEAAKAAVERARGGNGPTLIECKTYRHYTHFVGEPDTYRPPEEVEYWKGRDPITLYEAKLLSAGITREDIDKLYDEVEAELLAAIDFAERSKEPLMESALEDVYCS